MTRGKCRLFGRDFGFLTGFKAGCDLLCLLSIEICYNDDVCYERSENRDEESRRQKIFLTDLLSIRDREHLGLSTISYGKYWCSPIEKSVTAFLSARFLREKNSILAHLENSSIFKL